MQISGHGKADHLAKLLLGVQEADGIGATHSGKREAPKDRVYISEQAKQLQRIQALAQEPDESRAERIDRIRVAMESGTYAVSGRQVGDAILKELLTDAIV